VQFSLRQLAIASLTVSAAACTAMLGLDQDFYVAGAGGTGSASIAQGPGATTADGSMAVSTTSSNGPTGSGGNGSGGISTVSSSAMVSSAAAGGMSAGASVVTVASSAASTSSSSGGNKTCDVYSETFDDGTANDLTAGIVKVDWCDTYIPTSMNTPMCMSIRALRTNTSSEDPTMWIHQSAGCTQAKISYTYYQFATANVGVQYLKSSDTMPQCEKSGMFTPISSPGMTQACVQDTVTVPFGNSSAIYVRFEHGTGQNAFYVDNLSVKLEGCNSC
jgi:hypothetical protein